MIFEPQARGEWKIKYNEQVYPFNKSANITTIKILIIKWAGHVKRMDENESVRRIMEYKPEGIRIRGQTMLRWMDGAVKDLRKFGIKGCWMVARDKETDEDPKESRSSNRAIM